MNIYLTEYHVILYTTFEQNRRNISTLSIAIWIIIIHCRYIIVYKYLSVNQVNIETDNQSYKIATLI